MTVLQDLLLQSQRRTGSRKPITVIDPSKYDAFFERLQALDDKTVPLYFKAFIAFALSGGLRVSEALSVRVCDIDLEQGFYKVKVLKKHLKESDHNVIREVVLHSVATSLLKEYLAATPKLKTFSFLFRFRDTRQTIRFKRDHAYRMMQDLFGADACCHSIIRHSHISWLYERGLDAAKISRIVEIHAFTTHSYNHVNRLEMLRKVYKGA